MNTKPAAENFEPVQSETTTAALCVVDLKKRFGQLEVIKGLSLQAQRGDVISILGSSGSGKSTLLRCLSFLEEPKAGEIWVSGRQVKMRAG